MNRKKTMHSKHVLITTFSSLVVMGLLASQPAAAIDGKTYPDSMCQPSSDEVARFFVGTSNIDPNAGHSVICPVVRDVMGGSGIGSAYMFVDDNSPVEDVACVLYSLNSGGGIVAYSNRITSGSSGIQFLSFGTLASAGGGHYKIACRIPRAAPVGGGGFKYSRIVSYRIDENE